MLRTLFIRLQRYLPQIKIRCINIGSFLHLRGRTGHKCRVHIVGDTACLYRVLLLHNTSASCALVADRRSHAMHKPHDCRLIRGATLGCWSHALAQRQLYGELLLVAAVMPYANAQAWCST